MIWDILKLIGLLVLAWALYKIAKGYKVQRDLEKQGVVFVSKLAFLGDILKVIKTVKKYPHDLFANRMVEDAFGDKIPPKVGLYLFGLPIVLFTKCDVLDDFYVKYKEFFTKHKMQRSGAARPLI